MKSIVLALATALTATAASVAPVAAAESGAAKGDDELGVAAADPAAVPH